MVELVDSKDLGSFANRRVGSNPTIRIRTILTDLLDGLNSNEEK